MQDERRSDDRPVPVGEGSGLLALTVAGRRRTAQRSFSVDGTLLQAWASNRSFKPDKPDGDGGGVGNGFEGRNADVDFKGQKRSNKTHTSTTDPEAMLFRKATTLQRKCPTWVTC